MFGWHDSDLPFGSQVLEVQPGRRVKWQVHQRHVGFAVDQQQALLLRFAKQDLEGDGARFVRVGVYQLGEQFIVRAGLGRQDQTDLARGRLPGVPVGYGESRENVAALGQQDAAGPGHRDFAAGAVQQGDSEPALELDVLVNNAGVTGGWPQEPTTISPDTVRGAVGTNVVGVIGVTNAMLPLLRRSPSPRIVNLSSHVGSLGLQTNPDVDLGGITGAYAPSKTFLNAVTIQYVKELTGTHILINNACPGYVKTDFNNGAGAVTAEQGAAVVIRLATLPDDGPTGQLVDDNGTVPW